jgi:hypothetical protein
LKRAEVYLQFRTRGKEPYLPLPATFFFCISNLPLTDFTDRYCLQLTDDDNGRKMIYRHIVGEITDFTDKVRTVGGKPPTVTDSPDTKAYLAPYNFHFLSFMTLSLSLKTTELLIFFSKKKKQSFSLSTLSLLTRWSIKSPPLFRLLSPNPSPSFVILGIGWIVDWRFVYVCLLWPCEFGINFLETLWKYV